VSIARALMNGGQIILADEPTGALDSRSGAEVMALLRELADQGHTIILITHDRDVAQRARRIIEIKDGLILSDSGVDVGAATDKARELAALPHAGEAFWSDLGEAGSMALRALRANLFRTILTLLGIVIGVGPVVAGAGGGANVTLSATGGITANSVSTISATGRAGLGTSQPGGSAQVNLVAGGTIDTISAIVGDLHRGVITEAEAKARIEASRAETR
jgi:macrolide transport system ATP-binding/permease protein